MNKLYKYASVYAVLAGACDGLTGIMLMASPVFTLKLMGIGSTPSEPIYMQWIGAFVFSVGCAYFIPFFSSTPERRKRRMTGIFEFTAWIRIVIALFSGISIARGNLDQAWIAVTLTDITLAIIQLALLNMGAFRKR